MRGHDDPAALARLRWKKYPNRFTRMYDASTTPAGQLIGPVKADHRHGYVMRKAEGMGYHLVHPQAFRREG